MNRNQRILFSALFCGLVSIGQAQEKSKTYKETFNVGNETVLTLDTSHADIEFETWDKNQVEIIAVVELEGATDEEATTYFENDPIKIMGNSKEIKIETVGRSWKSSVATTITMDTLFVEDFISPRIMMHLPKVETQIEMPEMPPMPPIPEVHFDYETYEKEGEKYMEEWQKNFEKNFDEKYQKRFEEWSKRMEKAAERQERMLEARELKREKFIERREKLMEAREMRREKAMERREAAREKRTELHEKGDFDKKSLKIEKVIRLEDDGEGNIFYFNDGFYQKDGEPKKYKVKKHIKIKMPKSVKLKMDVRHGEVKLAENTKNLKASLSYASLLATTIDGNHTDIRASYSPVVVQKWNLGQLKTDYSDYVDLKEVGELALNAVSSNVTIDRVLDKVYVINNLGELQINSVSNNFSNVDITVENGEVDFKLPKTAFSIYVNETTSNVSLPKVLTLTSSKNYNAKVHKGHHINAKGSKSININAKYSDVVLQE